MAVYAEDLLPILPDNAVPKWGAPFKECFEPLRVPDNSFPIGLSGVARLGQGYQATAV